MNDENKPIKPRRPRGKSDRVIIEPKNLEKIDCLLSALIKTQPGLQISRKDLINWLIETRPSELSESETKHLITLHYDEEKFVRFALEEMRAAKLRGERVTLNDLLSRQTKAAAHRKRRQRLNSDTSSHFPLPSRSDSEPPPGSG